MAKLRLNSGWIIPCFKRKPERRCIKLWEHLMSRAPGHREDSSETVTFVQFRLDLRP
jgi:hypothetical protein